MLMEVETNYYRLHSIKFHLCHLYETFQDSFVHKLIMFSESLSQNIHINKFSKVISYDCSNL